MMPLSDNEVRQLTRMDAELARTDRRLNRSMQAIGQVNARLIKLSVLGLVLAVALVPVGAATGLPQMYIAAWFLFLFSVTSRCAAHLQRVDDTPEKIE